MTAMRRVILESPYAGNIISNVTYARACVRDCVMRNESVIASHLLYTQPGILDDANPAERTLGIRAGHAWMLSADAVVVYLDRGISDGMQEGIDLATSLSIPIERRHLPT